MKRVQRILTLLVISIMLTGCIGGPYKSGIKSLEDLVSKLNDRGTFVDLENSSIDQLSDTEIAALRYIFEVRGAYSFFGGSGLVM